MTEALGDRWLWVSVGVLAFSGLFLANCSDGPTGPSFEFDPGQTPVVVTEPVAVGQFPENPGEPAVQGVPVTKPPAL